MSDPPAAAPRPRAAAALRWWLRLCAAGAGSLVGARALHYLDLPLPDAVDRLCDRLMQAGLHSSIMWLQLFQPNRFGQAPVLVVLLALLVRPRWFVRRQEEGRLATMPWLYALMGGALAVAHAGLDLNPWVALGCAGSGALALARRRLGSRAVTAAVVGVFLAGWAALSPTTADTVALVAWGGVLALLALLRSRWLTGRDVVWLGAVLAVVTQIGASLPLPFYRNGGVMLGRGMAYGFCEQVDRGRLYAAVPGFPNRQFRDGHIVEYDTARLTQLRDLHLFDQSFHGRFMLLLCLPDTVQAAMALTWVSGGIQRENVMEFRVDDPREMDRSLWGPGMGQQIMWDDGRDAVFYSSEWSNRIFRLDRRTGQVNRNVNAGLIPDRPTWLFDLGTVKGSLAMAPTPHHRRDSFYVGHWLTGSTAYEIDLGQLTLRRTFEPRSGCIAELAVDEEYDRLYATSLWGLDVIDLKTGRVARRIRTGLGARTPAIDRQNGLVYVSTTIEGRLRAFDRTTLEPVGSLPIGYGIRRVLVSAATGRLFATNEVAYYWWHAGALAARLRGH